MLALNGNFRMTFHELFQVWHQNATRRRCIDMDDDFMTTVPPNRGGRVGEPIQIPPHMFEVIPAVPGQLHSLVFPNEQLDLEQGLEIADLVTDGGWGDATFMRCADGAAAPGDGLKSLKCWDCRQAGVHSSDSVFNRPWQGKTDFLAGIRGHPVQQYELHEACQDLMVLLDLPKVRLSPWKFNGQASERGAGGSTCV